jgi:hypothetical protein
MFKYITALFGAASAISITDFGNITLGESPTVDQEFENSRLL